jgi:hypothetical protein
MHIEKNVIDYILGTILDIKGKMKDNLATRTDLKELGLRPNPHLYTDDDGRSYLSVTCHTISNEEKTNFSKVIRNVRVPDRYASNVF